MNFDEAISTGYQVELFWVNYEGLIVSMPYQVAHCYLLQIYNYSRQGCSVSV